MKPVGPLLIASVVITAAASAHAQVTTCKTVNCEVGTTAGQPNLPPECRNIATPRLLEVGMTDLIVFDPANPRIEGESNTPGVPWSYQCILWRTTGFAAHSATEDVGCDTPNFACDVPQTMPSLCEWETGNIDNVLAYGTCHYRAVAPATYGFHCRIHGGPGFGMFGALTVVRPIELLVDKNLAGDALLSWSVGGVGSWNVWRDTTPGMPTPTNLAPGGTNLRSLTDPAAAGAAFYLVVERN